MDYEFGYWFSGFFDGEGHLAITRHKQSGCCSCRATIAQRDDSAGIMDLIQENLGGYLVRRKAVRTSRPQVVWTAATKEHCLDLARYLDTFPLMTRKADEYAIWREALDYWTTSKQGAPFNWLPFYEAADRLVAQRTYVAPLATG